MKLKRRIIAILMSLAMVLAYMPAMAFADDGDAASDSTQQTKANSEANQGAETESKDTASKSDSKDTASESDSEGAASEADSAVIGDSAQTDSNSSAGVDQSAGDVTSDTDQTAGAVTADTDQTAETGKPDSPDTADEDGKSEVVARKLNVDIGSEDELLMQYFEKEFGTEQSASKPGMLKASRAPRREKLSVGEKAAYDEILPQIKAIAAGTKREPIVSFDRDKFSNDDDVYTVIEALVIDYPYEFYWYDKTQYTYSTWYTVTLPVAEAYRGELIDADREIYALNTEKIAVASQAANNARDIVDKYKNCNDFLKLRKYKNEICDLTEYNDEIAAEMLNNDVPYGDPWQMIYVFDGDPATNVVCEGYAKAFQFLCDNSKFQSDQVECFTVTGAMAGGSWTIPEEDYGKYSNHMWNNLRMDDGKVYIADITNADVESVEQANALFLGGALPYNSYKLIKYATWGDNTPSITYAYDRDTLSKYDESELAVSTTSYKGVEHEHKPGDVIHEVYREPDCTEAGYHDDVILCELCNEVLSRVTVEDPPKGHTEVVIPGVAATCTENGLTEGKKCTVCNSITAVRKIIPARGHKESVVPGYAATCTKTGLTDGRKCTVCGEMTVEQKEIPALGHDWDSGVVTKLPTADEEGLRVRTCSRCGDEKEEIIPAGLTELTEDNVEVANAVYTGAKLEPAVTVTVDGEILTEGVDYELAYSNNINAGSGKVTVTGLVSYYGTVDKSFAIAKRAITPAVTLSTVNYTWNNGVKTPGVTVRYGTKTLKNGTDYTVAYQAGRKNIGRYNVTVTLKGNYSGRRVATFNINPKGTTANKPKASKKAFTAKWKKLTTKMPKATVTGYQVQYSTNKTFKTGAKTVTVKGAKKTSRKISSLKKKTTYYVRVRTYMSVGGRYYYSTWSAVKSVKTK